MFRLENLSPEFFKPKGDSQVWGKSIELSPSSRIRITAPSGTGKSSLVHFLAFTNKNYRGSILFEGTELGSIPRKEKSRLLQTRISIVFQDLRLINDLSVWENLRLKGSLGNFPAEEQEDMLRYFELFDKRDALVNSMSQGERQRIAIIRALSQKFDLLILDEPFSHLDSNWQEKAWDLIDKRSASNKAGLIYTSLDGQEKWSFDQSLSL